MWMTGGIPQRGDTTVYSAAVPPQAHTCHRLPPAVTPNQRVILPLVLRQGLIPACSTNPLLQYPASPQYPVPLQAVLHHKLARLRLQRKFMARGGSFQAALPSFPHTAVAAPPQQASWRGNSGSGEQCAGTTEQPHVT